MLHRLLLLFIIGIASLHAQKSDGKLRIIIFGPDPDDAQFRAGGATAK